MTPKDPSRYILGNHAIVSIAWLEGKEEEANIHDLSFLEHTIHRHWFSTSSSQTCKDCIDEYACWWRTSYSHSRFCETVVWRRCKCRSCLMWEPPLICDDVLCLFKPATYTKIGDLQLIDGMVEETKGQGRGDIVGWLFISICSILTVYIAKWSSATWGPESKRERIGTSGTLTLLAYQSVSIRVQHGRSRSKGIRNYGQHRARRVRGCSRLQRHQHCPKVSPKIPETIWREESGALVLRQRTIHRQSLLQIQYQKGSRRREKARIEGKIFEQWPWINDLTKNMDSTIFHEVGHSGLISYRELWNL